jgi:stage V sporulation protein B
MAEPGRQALAVAASVTGASMVVGAVLTGVVLHRRLGAFLPLASVARVVLAVGVAWAVGALLPSGGALVTLAEAAITAIVFLAVLVASRELGRRDLAAISAVRKKRGQGVEA